MDSENTYTAPEHGWTCFHCGETFKTKESAREHFGADELVMPGCQIKAGEEQGLLMALRRAEIELARYRIDDSDTERRMAAMECDHGRALRDAEEAGYAKGLEAGVTHLIEIEADGLRAGQSDRTVSDCPYDEGTPRALAWLSGWAKS